MVVAEDRLVAVMTAPLDSIVDGDVRVLPPAVAVRKMASAGE
ncbi:hypothetical protein [Actinophytocola glycyrrhizae]|uniref:Uncharacterized protein n=1 Tax=Actinophytocola glycyrrhizae TaxID=2044873 RepID=A0ABV9RVT3_9PSEU